MNNRNCYRVMLPVKPHTRKFIQTKYGNPLPIDNSTRFGTILSTLLKKKKAQSGLSNPFAKKRISNLTASIECFVSANRVARDGKSIPDEHAILFNRLIEAEFEEALYDYVKQHTGPKGRYPGYLEALRGFMQEYHICDELDISLDTLKKMEYRHRKRREDVRAKASQLA